MCRTRPRSSGTSSAPPSRAGAGSTPRSASGDLVVFYRDDSAQPSGEIRYLSRSSGIWNPPATLAGGAPTGFSNASAAADDLNDPGIAHVVYRTGTAAPFGLVEDAVAFPPAPATNTISGVVSAATEAVPNVLVSAYVGGGAACCQLVATTLSGTGGAYSLAVPVGTYRLSVLTSTTLNDYGPTWFGGASFATATDLVLGPSRSGTDLTVPTALQLATSSAPDPFAHEQSGRIFTMSDGARVAIYYDGSLFYRIKRNGTWDAPVQIGGPQCCFQDFPESVWTRSGDVLYGAGAHPTAAESNLFRLAYAAGSITVSAVDFGLGSPRHVFGIYYDGANNLVHLWHEVPSASGGWQLAAFDGTSLASRYSATANLQPATGETTGIAGDGGATFYLAATAGTALSVVAVSASATGYLQTTETGTPALAAAATGGAPVWDGSSFLYFANEADQKIRVTTRTGPSAYSAWSDVVTTPLLAGARPAVLRSLATGELTVFFPSVATQPNGEIRFVRRVGGVWSASSTLLAGGTAAGWSHVSAAASDLNSQDRLRVLYRTGATAPFGVVEDLVPAADPLTRPDAGSASPFALGAGPDGAFSSDPVNLATGSLTIHADDLTLPGRVLPIVFTRWYNSADTTTGPLGAGWTHSFNWTLADGTASITVRRGDGRQDAFTRNADGTYAAPPNVFDRLEKNADGSFTLTLTSQVQYEFSSAGRLVRIHEPAGNQIALAYGAGDLVSITDTVGRSISLSYDGSHHLVGLLDPLGRRMTYAYDTSGRLVTVTDKIGNAPGQNPGAHQWRYAYDGLSRHITTLTDPDGRVRVTNSYDAQGRVVQQRDGLGALTSVTYSPGQTVLMDPRGHAATYAFDSRMRVLSQSDPVGGSTLAISYTYDAAGNRTSVTDRNGRRTDFSYDARGNVLSKTDPSPDGVAPRPVTTFAYDSRNNLTQITDAAGFTTTLTYDLTTNVLLSVSRQIDATTSATTTYEYADAANPGLPTRIIAPRGNTGPSLDPTFATTLAYDAQGNLASRTDPDGARTTFGYDAAGRLLSFVDPDGNAAGANPAEHTWRISYDENARETARVDPLGNTLPFAYDGAGSRTSLTDRRGNVTVYAYDANTPLAAVQQKPDPVSNPTLVYTTTVTRDANGNATRITQANGVATDYAYDALNRLVSVTTHPDAQTTLTTSYVLDGNGQPTSRTTADGVTVSYAYDALSRLTSVSATGLAITYAYDALGRRTQMVDGTGTMTYQYDGLGRLTQVSAPNGRLSYAYDRDGNRTRLVYPNGDAVSYAYSPGGRLTTVADWASRVSSYTNQASGLVAGVTYPNGMLASYTYDRAQRLTQLTYTLGTTIVDETYTLDPEGNRIGINDFVQGMPATTGTLRYDGLSRLLSFDRILALDGGQPFTAESFAYDGATNLTSRTGPAATFTHDGANRVTSDGTRSFVWDRADRLVQRGADTFAYDPLSRLVSSTVSGVGRTYAYDGDGLLRSRTEGALTTSLLYDPSVAPSPLLQAGTDRILYGLGPLYRARADGTFEAYARDALGSVRAEVSGAGRLTNGYDYSAYGALRASLAGPPTLLGFAGELTDSSGLVYLRSRWYHPEVGRLMTSDSYLGQASEPMSLNLFGYAEGNPALKVDPSGHFPPIVVALAAGAGVGGVAGLLGYIATLPATHGTLNLRDAAVAFGAGAVSGAVCVTTLGGCALANTGATVAQYALSTGEKTVGGYVAAAAIGLATTPLVFTPLKPPTTGLSAFVYRMTRFGRLGRLEQGTRAGAAGAFLRSFSASLVATGAVALGAESPGAPALDDVQQNK